jgi:hypothetical protein
MKLLQYIIFIIKIETVEPYFIKNQNKPICANCKYFVPTNNECSKFGEINIITNEHIYEDAIIVRMDDNKCGEDAMFFKKNYFKFITISYYSIIENKDTINLLLSVVVTPFLLTYFMFYFSLQLFKC